MIDRLNEEINNSRNPNRQGNDFLRYAETITVEVDAPRDIRGNVIEFDNWMLASFEDNKLDPYLQGIKDAQQSSRNMEWSDEDL